MRTTHRIAAGLATAATALAFAMPVAAQSTMGTGMTGSQGNQTGRTADDKMAPAGAARGTGSMGAESAKPGGMGTAPRSTGTMGQRSGTANNPETGGVSSGSGTNASGAPGTNGPAGTAK